ncbi:MAG: type II toxin-antitoxin system RelE/ParE family toxin [Alphaproteobacteria bacterium]|jgi:plasmid stabilization system protein ParE|nr:type II toxin-antitoxin system RelE/ParE family toxin [Alphaproteobacteria bacterium]
MTPYAVEFTTRALGDIRRLIEGAADQYTLDQRVAYARSVRMRCFSLAQMPRRYPASFIQGRSLRKASFQAHVIYYSLDEDRQLVTVEAILHGRQDPGRSL